MSDPIQSIMALHDRLRLPPINKMYRGVWDKTVGPWRFVVNASGAEIEDAGVRVPNFFTYVEFNGWLAGMIDPLGNGQFTAGTVANFEAFCAALDAEARS